jgi:hypothetical protein
MFIWVLEASNIVVMKLEWALIAKQGGSDGKESLVNGGSGVTTNPTNQLVVTQGSKFVWDETTLFGYQRCSL